MEGEPVHVKLLKGNTMYYENEVTDYRTSAPDGVYLAISEKRCDVTGALLVSKAPLIVLRGLVFSETVERAAKSFVQCHPHHCFLEEIQWDGGKAFTLSFGS